MNYLAHVYLSGGNIDIAIGNFIADSIKGNKYQNYPVQWQRGILLHRFIDSYTDSHDIFKDHAKLFFDSHRHYSRVLIDMFYDHLLAKNWSKYSNVSLNEFSKEFYKNLTLEKSRLPVKVQSALKYLIQDDWFNCYSTIGGLTSILSQMESRTNYPSKLSSSIDKFVSLLSLIEPQFFLFFKDIEYAVKINLIEN